MNRRGFIKGAAGLLIASAPAIVDSKGLFRGAADALIVPEEPCGIYIPGVDGVEGPFIGRASSFRIIETPCLLETDRPMTWDEAKRLRELQETKVPTFDELFEAKWPESYPGSLVHYDGKIYRRVSDAPSFDPPSHSNPNWEPIEVE